MSDVPMIRVSATTTESHDPKPWRGGIATDLMRELDTIRRELGEPVEDGDLLGAIRRLKNDAQSVTAISADIRAAAQAVGIDAKLTYRESLAELCRMADRWRFVRKYFETDGDAEEGGGTWTSVIAVNEDELHRATCRDGIIWTVDELIDAAIEARK
jgi:hypothetical protein